MSYVVESNAYVQRNLSGVTCGFLTESNFTPNQLVVFYGDTKTILEVHKMTFEYFYKSKILIINCGEGKISGVNNITKFFKRCGITSITSFIIHFSKEFKMCTNSHKINLNLVTFVKFNIYQMEFELESN